MKRFIIVLLAAGLLAALACASAPTEGLPQPIPGLAQAGGEERAEAYTVTVVDQNGEPVPGVFINFCTDATCTPAMSDENGVITFAGEPDVYHLQVLKAPEGYSFDASFEAYTEAEYGAMTVEIVKD